MGRWFTCSLMIFILFGLVDLNSETLAEEKYPATLIKLIIPTEAGADGDTLLRPLLEKVSARLGQPMVVINKPGAGGALGYLELHDAKPDGHTIGLGFPTIFINKMRGVLPYDHHGFTVVCQHASFTPIVVASTKTARPFKTIQEVLSFAKSNPGKVSVAISGIGQSWWVAAMLFQSGTGLDFHMIPQAGSGAIAVTQAAGGHTDLAVVGLASGLSQIEAGNVRFIATYGEKRVSGKYNNVPTFKELGYDITWDSINFIMGPPKMPAPIVDKLAKAFKEEATKPEFQEYAIKMNATPVYRGPEETVKYLDEQSQVCRKILEKAGLVKEK